MLSKNLPNPEAWILYYQNKQTYFSLAKNVLIVLVCKSLSCVQLFVTPWTGAHQAPPFMGFSRQEYWSGLPFPSPGDLHNPGLEPGHCRQTLPSESLGKTVDCNGSYFD